MRIPNTGSPPPPDTNKAPACQWCGVIHLTAKCPQVKSIEYHANGKVKRVEFHADKPMVGGVNSLAITT